MIKSVHLSNFQDHEDTKLEFSEGINVIVGTTNSGKTAILRAIEWVRRNRPSGNSFVRHGTNSANVALIVKDGKESSLVVRTRVENRNSYTIGSQKFDAIKTDVPVEVDRVLNMSDLNVQAQLSPHFLILDSPGAIGRTINEVVNLDLMDGCIVETNKRIRQNKGTLDAIKEQIKANEKKQSKFSAVFDKIEDAKTIMKTEEELSEFINARYRLSGAIDRMVSCEAALASLPIVDDFVVILADVEKEINEHDSLAELCKLLEQNTKRLGAIPNNEKLVSCEEIATLAHKTVSDHKKLTSLVFSMENAAQGLVEDSDRLEKAEQAVNELVGKLVVCPICGQLVKKE